jgi:hypothetical protein
MGTSLFNTTPAATYPALIKVGDNTSIDGALKTLSDGAGNDLPIQVSSTVTNFTGNVGIGTTAPIYPLNVYNSNASVANLILLEQDTSAVLGQINNYRKNGSVNLTSGTELGRLSFGGYFNSTYSPPSQVCSAINGYYGGTGTDRVGGLRLITWNGGGATTRIQVSPDGKIGIGTTAPSAKLSILGEGSTSATTSLLVQNSAGTTLLQTLDDATTTLAGKTFTGTGTILVPSQAHSASDIVMKGDSALISANGNANQWGKIILCDVGAGTTYQNYSVGHFFKIGTTSPTTYLSIVANLVLTGSSTRLQMGAQDASDIYQGTSANVYGSFLPFGSSGNTVFKNSYTQGSYRFFTAPAVDGTLVEVLRITNTGNVGIGATGPTARLQVQGSGTTSGTTSLLVQNSLGTAALEVKDNGTISTFNNEVVINKYTVGGLIMSITTGQHFGARGINVTAGETGIIANSHYGVSTNSPLGASIVANGGGSSGGFSLGLLSRRALISTAANALGMSNSAMLQADSTTQGFLPPRMTTAEKNLIATPATGLQVHDTDLNRPCFYNGASWVTL